MVEQHGWQYFVASGAIALVPSALSACAVAPAQTPPPSGSGASSAPSTTAPSAAPEASSAPASTAPAASAAPAAPYSGPPPYYFVRPPRVTAGLTPDAVHRVFMRAPNQQAIVTCYTTALATDPRAHGTVSLRLEVIAGGFGSVDTVRFAPANDTLRDCVRAALGRFEWPNPSGVPSTQVDAQIDLAPTPPPAAAHGHH
jgi:hypothetical protein